VAIDYPQGPLLTWNISLESFERDLAVSRVEICTCIPQPPVAWEGFCYPGTNERSADWVCDEFLVMDTPGHKIGSRSGSAQLPWRESGEYPEVEAGLRALRDAFEAHLMAVYDSLPVKVSGSLESSSQARKHLAPGFAAQRFLRVVGGQGDTA
jgi:hypothetical protein